MPAALTAEGIGRLRARGMLQLKQFWPKGKSDADTANITIDLALKPAFVFRPSTGTEKATGVFDDAQYDDRGAKKPILGAQRDKLRVRLQGIDAPELHYPAVGPQYRQNLAESAVYELGKMLESMAAGAPSLRADVVTFVNLPGDAFDMYGRYVGNITVYADGFSVDINHWLLEHGWTVPGLYNSMTEREITVARTLAAAAAKKKIGLYKSAYYREKLVAFDQSLRPRTLKQGEKFKTYDDAGPLMNPKFFRRQADFVVGGGATTVAAFRQHLQSTNRTALLYSTYSGLSKADKKNVTKLKKLSAPLGKLLGPGGSLPAANDIINIEGDAKIFDAKGNKLDKWDF